MSARRGPELLARTAEPTVVGELHAHLEEPVHRGPLLEVTRTQGRLRVPGVAAYATEVDGPVSSRPESTATAADLRCFLTGPVRALDLTLHGVPCLRAAAVRLGEGAVVVCGPSGSGTSVLAAALARRGHPVLADGVVPLATTGPVVELWPTSDRVQLWPAAARQWDLDPEAGSIVRPALAKRAYALGPSDPAAPPVPVTRIVVLTVDLRSDDVAEARLTQGGARVAALARATWHADVAQALDPLGHLAATARLADRLPMTVLSRPRETWTADALADLLGASA